MLIWLTLCVEKFAILHRAIPPHAEVSSALTQFFAIVAGTIGDRQRERLGQQRRQAGLSWIRLQKLQALEASGNPVDAFSVLLK